MWQFISAAVHSDRIIRVLVQSNRAHCLAHHRRHAMILVIFLELIKAIQIKLGFRLLLDTAWTFRSVLFRFKQCIIGIESCFLLCFHSSFILHDLSEIQSRHIFGTLVLLCRAIRRQVTFLGSLHLWCCSLFLRWVPSRATRSLRQIYFLQAIWRQWVVARSFAVAVLIFQVQPYFISALMTIQLGSHGHIFAQVRVGWASSRVSNRTVRLLRYYVSWVLALMFYSSLTVV